MQASVHQSEGDFKCGQDDDPLKVKLSIKGTSASLYDLEKASILANSQWDESLCPKDTFPSGFEQIKMTLRHCSHQHR